MKKKGKNRYKYNLQLVINENHVAHSGSLENRCTMAFMRFDLS
jgi:hypothetical protein